MRLQCDSLTKGMLVSTNWVSFGSATLSTVGSIVLIIAQISNIINNSQARRTAISNSQTSDRLSTDSRRSILEAYYTVFFDPTMRLVFWLAVSDLLSSVVIMLSQLLLLFDASGYTFNMCIGIRAVFQIFMESSFLWTACLAYSLWMDFTRPQMTGSTNAPSIALLEGQARRDRRFLIICHIICWLIPTGSVIGQVFTKQFQRMPGGWCHPNELAIWLFWFLPLMLCFAWISVFFVIITYRLYKTFRGFRTELRVAMGIQGRLNWYLVAFILCWVWDITSHVIYYINPECNIFWLMILSNFGSPLQGFVNFLVFGLPMMAKVCRQRNGEKEALLDSGSSAPPTYESYYWEG